MKLRDLFKGGIGGSSPGPIPQSQKAFVKPPIVYCPRCNYEMRPVQKRLGDHHHVECVTNNCLNRGKVFELPQISTFITEVLL